MTQSAGLNRRSFLRGRLKDEAPPLRPPWSNDERIAEHCLACGKCAEACPQGIIGEDRRGHPTVSFAHGECTFCGACADICPAPVFAGRMDRPWKLKLSLGKDCLATNGITCRSCGDTCPENAIRFRPKPGGAVSVAIDEDACISCGACISVCPKNALTLQAADKTEEGLDERR